jgi:predicted acylesterase/phospholipase RssA
MRRALVLSSGGAKASWQVGACEHLIVERRYWFDVITGVSAGAVNGTTLAQAHDQKELEAELERVTGSVPAPARHPEGEPAS